MPVNLEELSDEDLKKLEQQFQRLRRKAEHNGTESRKAQSAKSRKRRASVRDAFRLPNAAESGVDAESDAVSV
jgi:hypothetical protein